MGHRRGASKGNRWTHSLKVKVVESAIECGLELSTFVGCGGTDLGKRREEEGEPRLEK